MIYLACIAAFAVGALVGNHFSQGLFLDEAKKLYEKANDSLRG